MPGTRPTAAPDSRQDTEKSHNCIEIHAKYRNTEHTHTQGTRPTAAAPTPDRTQKHSGEKSHNQMHQNTYRNTETHKYRAPDSRQDMESRKLLSVGQGRTLAKDEQGWTRMDQMKCFQL